MASLACCVLVALGAIDRESVVRRHTVRIVGAPAPPPLSTPLTLSVGNGVIGFNAGADGLQSLNTSYRSFPLTTLSDWGWHSSPPPRGQPDPFADFGYSFLNTSEGRAVPYPLNTSGGAGGGPEWLRANPHRLDLLQVALRRRADTATPLVLGSGGGKGAAGDVPRASSVQVLDPYSGELVSNFSVVSGASRAAAAAADADAPATAMSTRTVCHMDLDLLSWRVEGAPLQQQQQQQQQQQAPPADEEHLVLRLAFPYGSMAEYSGGNDWERDDAHSTTLVRATADSALFRRRLDWDEYVPSARYSQQLTSAFSFFFY